MMPYVIPQAQSGTPGFLFLCITSLTSPRCFTVEILPVPVHHFILLIPGNSSLVIEPRPVETQHFSNFFRGGHSRGGFPSFDVAVGRRGNANQFRNIFLGVALFFSFVYQPISQILHASFFSKLLIHLAPSSPT